MVARQQAALDIKSQEVLHYFRNSKGYQMTQSYAERGACTLGHAHFQLICSTIISEPAETAPIASNAREML